MSGRTPLEDQLRALFADELDGHVAALNVDLLALERATADADVAALLQRLFRTTHTIKGASRAASAPVVERLAHRLEDVLTGVREERIDRDPLLYDALFGATDALGLARDDLAAGRETADAAVADVLARLAELDGGVTDVVRADTASLRVTPAAEPDPAPVAGNQVRIAAEKIDALLATSGELLVALGRLDDGPDRRALVGAVRALHDDLVRLRMVPFRDACQALERATRDLAAGLGKEVDLVVRGGERELDRAVVDALRDPLLHLVRNAVDHGIEAPDERIAAGKPPRGTIEVSATVRGADVTVEVRDDGRGLDLGAIREGLERRGVRAPDDDEQVADGIFLPGLSTARAVTDVSGRGVGLDVVRRGIEAIRGAVTVGPRPGGGTRFEIRAPLTLSSLRVLLVVVSGQTFAIPASSVKLLLRVAQEDVRRLGGADTVRVDGRPVPLVPLAGTLGLAAGPSLTQGRVPVVVLAGASQAAVVVDALLEELEVVVKPLGPRLRGARAVTGAILLPSGRVALILSVPEILGRARAASGTDVFAVTEVRRKRRILLADDSITTRTLERSILEGAGYTVTVAVDGADAWRLLQESAGAVDVVVSDVEMPNMDGFTLVETIRGSPRFQHLPVILVTGLARDEHRARGLAAGASAYLVKSAFDQQQLLDTIEQVT